MGKHIDLAGQKFRKLVVIRLCEKLYKGRWRKWLCECECGNFTEVLTSKLRSGHTSSCGCISTFKGSHFKSNTRLYKIWSKIKERCYNPNSKIFKYYGGNNINMCEEWLINFESFYNWAINNGYKKHLSLDRFPNHKGNYKPENCRWATSKQQNRNSAHNVILSINNESMCISEFAEKYNLNYITLYTRIKRGCPVDEKILMQPVKKH